MGDGNNREMVTRGENWICDIDMCHWNIFVSRYLRYQGIVLRIYCYRLGSLLS